MCDWSNLPDELWSTIFNTWVGCNTKLPLVSTQFAALSACRPRRCMHIEYCNVNAHVPVLVQETVQVLEYALVHKRNNELMSIHFPSVEHRQLAEPGLKALGTVLHFCCHGCGVMYDRDMEL